MRLLPRLLLTALVLFAAPALAQDAPSLDTAEEADLHFRIAIDHYARRDYQGALEHLLTSNRLVPNKNVVFNIARTYEQLGLFDQAFRHYHEYVTLEADADARATGEASIERIRSRVALVAVESDPPGAVIYVDRRDLGARGSTPQTLALPPGEHTVLLELAGHEGASATTEARRGETATVRASLAPILGVVQVAGAPAGATIRLGSESGPVVGELPGTLRLPPGPQVLVVDAPSYQGAQRVVTVDPEQDARLHVELSVLTGQLVVDALERDALIEIDGRAAGFTPAVLDVPVGAHVVRVSRAGFRAHEEEILVVQGERVALDVRLRSAQEITAATRTARTIEQAPASVSVISREEIRAFGYQTVYDALAATRGVFQTHDLTYASLGIRGFGRPGDYGNRVLSTIDGHTMNDDLLGASYIGNDLTSDLYDVQQIEVVRGPGSALYGTNAFFGVLNVVTADDEALPRPHIAFTADGGRTARARVGAGVGDARRGGWFGLGGFGAQGGDYQFPEWEGDAPGGLSQRADGAFGGTFQAKAWFDDVTVQAYFNGRRKRIPTGAFETLLGDPRAATTDLRSFVEVRWEPALSERVRLYTRAYNDFYAYMGDYPYGRDIVTSDRWTGAWAGVEPRLVASPTDWLELTAGAEARFYYHARLLGFDQTGGSEERYLDERPTQQVYAGYLLGEARAGDFLRVSVGGRYDHFTLERTGGAFSPRAAVIWSPGEHDVIKVVGGTAFRAPSPYEWFYNDDGFTQIVPEQLAAERIWTGELEYSHRFDDVTSLTIAGYFNHLPNLIDTELTGTQGEQGELFWYANSAAAISTLGAEYELRREWRRGILFAFQHSMQRTREGSLISGSAISNSPEHLLALKGAAPIVPGLVTAATRLRAETPRVTSTRARTEWALLWDLTVTGEVPSAPLRFGLGVRNLLDWQHNHPGGVELRMPHLPQPGRTFFASLEAHL